MAKKTEQKEQAKKRYLQSAGEINITNLAKEIRVHRITLQNWIKAGRWKEEIRDTRPGSLTDSQEKDRKMFEQFAGNAQLVNRSITEKLFKRNDAGEILRDEKGIPRINDKLKASDYRALASAADTSLKIIRAISTHTENLERLKLEQDAQAHAQELDKKDRKNNSSGSCTPNIDPIAEIMAGIDNGTIDSGEGQEALEKLARAYQNVKAVAAGEPVIA